MASWEISLANRAIRRNSLPILRPLIIELLDYRCDLDRGELHQGQGRDDDV